MKHVVYKHLILPGQVHCAWWPKIFLHAWLLQIQLVVAWSLGLCKQELARGNVLPGPPNLPWLSEGMTEPLFSVTFQARASYHTYHSTLREQLWEVKCSVVWTNQGFSLCGKRWKKKPCPLSDLLKPLGAVPLLEMTAQNKRSCQMFKRFILDLSAQGKRFFSPS